MKLACSGAEKLPCMAMAPPPGLTHLATAARGEGNAGSGIARRERRRAAARNRRSRGHAGISWRKPRQLLFGETRHLAERMKKRIGRRRAPSADPYRAQQTNRGERGENSDRDLEGEDHAACPSLARG